MSLRFVPAGEAVSAVNLPELVAQLRDIFKPGWLSSGLCETKAADFIQRLIDALPVCPTCDGKQSWQDSHGIAHEWEINPCPDCTDGKMSVEWMAAIVNAVMATTYDHLAWTTDQVKAGQYDTHPIIASLRAVKP